MKKFLTVLAAIGITGSAATTVIACGNNSKNQVDPLTDAAIISRIATEAGDKTTTGSLTLDVANNQQTQDNIKDAVVNSLPNLSKYKKWLDVKVTSFTPASQQGDKGLITLNLAHNQEAIKNPQDNTNNFVFSFLTKDIVGDMEQITQKVVSDLNNHPEINLADFKVNLGSLPLIGGENTIQGLITTIFNYVMPSLPKQIPTKFSNDANWTKFQFIINTLKETLGDKNSVSTAITLGEGMVLNIKLTISDVVATILPDLVHFSNFITEQNQAGNTNLILDIIQYLFDTPRDINNDGFTTINQNIKDINHEGQMITFKNNFERLVYDLLEGWKTTDGIQVPDAKPVQIDFVNQPIKYQTDTTNNDNLTIGILDLIPESNLTNFIDFVLGASDESGYDLKEPLPFTLTLNGALLGMDENWQIPIKTDNLATAIKGSMKTLLNTRADLANKLDYLTFSWTQGTMTIEYLAQDGTWTQVKTITDLLLSNKPKDLRVKFINNTWEVGNKLNSHTDTLANKDLILNLNVTVPVSTSSISK